MGAEAQVEYNTEFIIALCILWRAVFIRQLNWDDYWNRLWLWRHANNIICCTLLSWWTIIIFLGRSISRSQKELLTKFLLTHHFLEERRLFLLVTPCPMWVWWPWPGSRCCFLSYTENVPWWSWLRLPPDPHSGYVQRRPDFINRELILNLK